MSLILQVFIHKPKKLTDIKVVTIHPEVDMNVYQMS